MLTRIHFGLPALADHSGMKFSLWGYFWSIIWRILTDIWSLDCVKCFVAFHESHIMAYVCYDSFHIYIRMWNYLCQQRDFIHNWLRVAQQQAQIHTEAMEAHFVQESSLTHWFSVRMHRICRYELKICESNWAKRWASVASVGTFLLQ